MPTTPAARERAQVRMPLLLVSATAWALLGLGAMGAHAHEATPIGSAVRMTLQWILMFAAMMAPLMTAPVRHVRDRSLPRRRARALALFTAGYCTTGAALALLLMSAATALPPALSAGGALTALAALTWQCSPAKQRCLNRCHAHRALALTGAAADADALWFGCTHGSWCVASCGGLMALPLLVARGHTLMMLAVTLWLAGERLERPASPAWRLRGPGKAVRLAVASARALAE